MKPSIGTGFELDWMGYDCPTDSPNLDQGICVATCPNARQFIDQLTCVTACPDERLIIDQEKTCVASCPAARPNEQGTCVTTCPPERPLVSQSICENVIFGACYFCAAACPAERPNILIVLGVAYCWVTPCPIVVPDTNGDGVCGN